MPPDPGMAAVYINAQQLSLPAVKNPSVGLESAQWLNTLVTLEEKTQVQFLAPTCGSQPSVILVPGIQCIL